MKDEQPLKLDQTSIQPPLPIKQATEESPTIDEGTGEGLDLYREEHGDLSNDNT